MTLFMKQKELWEMETQWHVFIKSYVYIFTEKLKNQAESYIFLSGNKNYLFIPSNSVI